jgi:hypothetical protein
MPMLFSSIADHVKSSFADMDKFLILKSSGPENVIYRSGKMSHDTGAFNLPAKQHCHHVSALLTTLA